MRVYRSRAELAAGGARRRAVTLGVFDGCHRGHARIVAATREAAARRDLDAALAITFWPHPLSLVAPERAPALILDLEERIAALAATGLDELLILGFDAELAATHHADFARRLVGELGMLQLVVGYDFHLGRGRAGDAETMAALGEELGYRVEVVTPCYQNGRIISSSHIRRDLAAGRLGAVAQALGRPWTLSGAVEPGAGRGRELGFRTANLSPPAPEKLLPPRGVYRVRVELPEGTQPGLMNLGEAPTLRGRLIPEIHLLDWEGDLRGTTLQVSVLEWLRPEARFPDVAALKAAIAADVDALRRRLTAGDPDQDPMGDNLL